MDPEISDVFDVLQRRDKTDRQDSFYSDPHAANYISSLACMSVDQFTREPERLAEERTVVLEQTEELAYSHYKTFVETSRTGKEVQKEFKGIERQIVGLLDVLPKFSNRCQQFSKEAQAISAHRRLNSLTLSKHAELVEILELAQLMETCVRNGCYEEALELASFVRRLEIKHGKIPIIGSIVREVQESMRSMLNLLIAQLRGSLSLPQCLRVIGFIRQTEVFSEPELRIKFLQARNTWFTTSLESIDRRDPYSFIAKCIEVHRVHLFDILTQYRAIFADDDHHLYGHHQVFNINHSYLLSSWVIVRIQNFLATLESSVGQKELEGRLDSILSQCMYFGLSFSRIGCDFRPLLIPIFAKATLGFLQTSLQEANQRFRTSLQTFSLIKATSTMNRSKNDNPLHPPLNLLEFFPLAEFCNLVLQALNTLRLCCPVSLVSDVTSAVSTALENAAKEIAEFHRHEEQTFTGAETENFTRFVSYFVLDLTPFLSRCVQALFPAAALAQVLGRTPAAIKRSGLGIVSLKKVVSPLESLIPEETLLEALALQNPEALVPTAPSDVLAEAETPTVTYKIQEAVQEEAAADDEETVEEEEAKKSEVEVNQTE
ncbi:unnamed protein product [Cyprideis torosa]|uniref:Conserved oligomeric Golgi complex subunit 8 n=1 Tax=Cyprideis torosa TaxID=163714 RepID=A0A7R8ZLR8_9CRUS|nr:unnamed protein product [Cyprideis torosa]CAG0882807.1 unnamed protein product [Cyprideis torosa]